MVCSSKGGQGGGVVCVAVAADMSVQTAAVPPPPTAVAPLAAPAVSWQPLADDIFGEVGLAMLCSFVFFASCLCLQGPDSGRSAKQHCTHDQRVWRGARCVATLFRCAGFTFSHHHNHTAREWIAELLNPLLFSLGLVFGRGHLWRRCPYARSICCCSSCDGCCAVSVA